MSTVAVVSAASGETSALRGGQTVPLSAGSALEAGDVLVTGPDSELTVRFNDDSVIDLSASTRVEVRDFLFEPQEQAFSLNIMEGAFRSVSGKIVEHNPEAFAITSPLGVVGIRGTETMHIVSSKFEVHSVLSLSQGHTVFIRATDGRSIVIGESLKGVILAVGDQTPLQEFDVTPQELENYLKLLQGQSFLHHDPGGYFLLGDAAFLASLGAFDLLKNVAFLPAERLDALLTSLDAIDEKLGPVLLDRLDEPAIAVDHTGIYQECTGSNQYYAGTSGNDTLVLAGGGNNTLFAGPGDDSITIRASDQGGNNLIMGGYGSQDVITVEREFTSDTLLGDAQTLPADVHGDNDIIILQGPMDGGQICGDADFMKSDTLDYAAPRIFGGNDVITVMGSMNGGTICGDALYAVAPEHVSQKFSAPQVQGGDDVIDVYSDLSDGIIFGDFAEIGQRENAVCGNDRITVHGDMIGGQIYGDVNAESDHAGNDVIIVHGDMSGGAIYGDGASLNGVSGGSNSIVVDGTMSGGLIYGGLGNDHLVIGTYQSGQINTQAGNDTLEFKGYGSGVLGNDSLSSVSGGQAVPHWDGHADTYDPDDDLFVFAQPTSGDATLHITHFGTEQGGQYGWDRIDLSAFDATNVNVQGNTITCAASGGTLTLVLDGVANFDQSQQLILS